MIDVMPFAIGRLCCHCVVRVATMMRRRCEPLPGARSRFDGKQPSPGLGER